MGLPEEDIRDISAFFQKHVAYEDDLGKIRILTDHSDWDDYVALERRRLERRRSHRGTNIEPQLRERISSKLTLNEIETLSLRIIGSL